MPIVKDPVEAMLKSTSKDRTDCWRRGWQRSAESEGCFGNGLVRRDRRPRKELFQGAARHGRRSLDAHPALANVVLNLPTSPACARGAT